MDRAVHSAGAMPTKSTLNRHPKRRVRAATPRPVCRRDALHGRRAATAQDAEDARSLDRANSGDRSGLAEIYRRHAPVAFGLALRILRDEIEAQDVVHDAFVLFIQHLDRCSPEEGSVFSWLITIVRNLALDRARKRAVHGRLARERIAHEPRDSARGPDVLGEARHTWRRVQHSLGDLAPAELAALQMAFFSGLSYSQIAASERVPLGTVKSRVSRGLASLRAAFS